MTPYLMYRNVMNEVKALRELVENFVDSRQAEVAEEETETVPFDQDGPRAKNRDVCDYPENDAYFSAPPFPTMEALERNSEMMTRIAERLKDKSPDAPTPTEGFTVSDNVVNQEHRCLDCAFDNESGPLSVKDYYRDVDGPTLSARLEGEY